MNDGVFRSFRTHCWGELILHDSDERFFFVVFFPPFPSALSAGGSSYFGG